MIKYYTAFISYAMIGAAFCSTKGLDDEIFNGLKGTAHKPHYENLTYDKENVRDETALRKGAHVPDYTAEVVAIDHEGETITIKKGKKKTGKQD